MTPHNVGDPLDPTLIKTKSKINWPGRKGENQKASKTSESDGKPPSIKKGKSNQTQLVKFNDEAWNLRNIREGDEKPSSTNNDKLKKTSSKYGGEHLFP